MNVVTIKINGVEYNLKGDEREEYLHMVASYVDKKIKNIMSNNEKLSTSSAAILTALNLGDDMFKSKSLCKELLSKGESLEKHDNELTEQLEGLKKQLNHLEDYNQELLNKCKNTEKTEYVKTLEQENIEMQQQLDVMQVTSKSCIEENRRTKTENKEMRFKLQSYKYKIIDSQNKLIEYQISLAKQKKINNPLLASHKK
ncbi:cell division protein ZapA [Clostridium sp. CM028]|uniref:cell division protein ZapA n=1 Tax=unclassified Clostridium TaxID=2614128 RepID=UPI001C0C5B0E|nr:MULTISPECIES: cell division protein ZapA [unclassified Clostridium]MBU3092456.1 cell division protein ZapA [Clostridium sp. CF011]MBW9146924.1 cell division protein ZapA [Clostridium sp. CM027]MBW9148052.1 cell division protein ZapA [Clostridium sp. CM028]UVE40811.1 cell division protein ZapA [Clostridium sp. CM027]WAG69792.1 cell division protein ZapA [Clostridium sp. CF011]